MAETIRGMSNLKRAFKDLAKQGERNKSTALKIVGQEYANDVKAITPYKTGTLRRSIHVEPVSENTVLVGTDLPYARRLEYGFMDKDKLGRIYHQAPRPYFRPPLDQNFAKYQRMYLEALHLA
jgi:phage gpG-like protein